LTTPIVGAQLAGAFGARIRPLGIDAARHLDRPSTASTMSARLISGAMRARRKPPPVPARPQQARAAGGR